MRLLKMAGIAAMLLLLLTANLPADQFWLQQTGATGSLGDVETNPYQFNAYSPADHTQLIAQLSLMCDDATYLASPALYETTDYTNGKFKDGNSNTYGTFSGLQLYNMVAYLDIQILNTVAQGQSTGELSFALWRITDGDVLGYWNNLDSTQQGAVDTLIAGAKLHMDDNGLANSLVIYKPVDPSINQEFTTIVPEPSGLVLFGFGLVALGGFLRRRFE